MTAMPTSPVFIVGVGRSGTTLVRAMLNAHSAFAIAPETHFLDNVAPRWQGRDLADPAVHAELMAQLRATKKLRRLARDRTGQALDRVPPGPMALRDAMAEILAEHGRRQGKARWGEKTPRHFRFIARLFEWFPGARVVWMVRDPRAVVASRLRTRWASPYIHRNARAWNQAARLASRWRVDARVHIVRYEDLVGAPGRIAAEICAFLDEPFEPAMVEAPEVARLATSQSSYADEAGTSPAGAISRDAVDRWRTHLRPYEVQAIEHLCGQGMRRLGYARSTSGAGLRARAHITSSYVRYAPRGVRRLIAARRRARTARR